MRRCMMENPAAGDDGVPRCLAGRRDASENKQNRRALQDSAKIDELLWRLGDALRMGHIEGWERDFAKSLLGQAKRRRSRWNPSVKQLATLRRVIAGLAEPDTGPLIDEDGGDAAA